MKTSAVVEVDRLRQELLAPRHSPTRRGWRAWKPEAYDPPSLGVAQADG
jgi:hypothetical protein